MHVYKKYMKDKKHIESTCSVNILTEFKEI